MPNFIIYRQRIGEGQWTATAPSISVIGFGSSEDDALANLAESVQRRFDLFMDGDDKYKPINYSEVDVMAIDLHCNVDLTFSGGRPRHNRQRKIGTHRDAMDERDSRRNEIRESRRRDGRIDPEMDMMEEPPKRPAQKNRSDTPDVSGRKKSIKPAEDPKARPARAKKSEKSSMDVAKKKIQEIMDKKRKSKEGKREGNRED